MTKAYEILGYFEEVIDAKFGNLLGTRTVEDPGERKMGYHGMLEYEVVENLTLTRGPKTVIVKASKAKPLRVRTMLQYKCGHLLRDVHDEDRFRAVSGAHKHKYRE